MGVFWRELTLNKSRSHRSHYPENGKFANGLLNFSLKFDAAATAALDAVLAKLTTFDVSVFNGLAPANPF